MLNQRASLALLTITAMLAATSPASSSADTFAPGFSGHTVTVGGRAVYYRIGGTGPAILLIHGYGDTGQMWAPLVPLLAKDHRVIVPDLPGLGSSRPQSPEANYDMAGVARSLHALMAKLHIRQEAVVGHDIGLMVAYAYAAQFPGDVTRLALLDAPIPGVGPWEKVLLSQATVQFHFFGQYAEELTAGHERIYLDHIWDTFAYHPERVTEATRSYYAASYAQPGNMHAGFSYFAGFYSDADDNARFANKKLTMPVLAMGGVKSLGALEPQFARAVATNVQTSVIPDSGHWLMDENPRATSAVLMRFLNPAQTTNR